MALSELKALIARLPEQPGVYLYLDRHGETIYVGKARTLRDRVRSYLAARGSSPKTDALLDEIAGLEFIVTDSVVEALALENHLIKQRTPKYNVLLRDDKTYPYLQLTSSERFPRVLVARRVEKDGNVYAGPFMPAALARRTMSLTHRLFGIRSCNEVIDGGRGRPCLEYDIRRCVAPCVREICDEFEYGRAVDRARLFLEGRNDDLLADLHRQMRGAAAAEQFERAAELRDAIRTVETLRDRQQKMATPGLGDRDAFGVTCGPGGAVVVVFEMRSGRVVERVELVTGEHAVYGPEAADALAAALQQFYEDRVPPPEVHLPVPVEEADAVEGWLTARAGRRVRLLVPRRGDKRGLLDLAARNAAIGYRNRFDEAAEIHDEALEELRRVLALPTRPSRIDCFDVSTIHGRETVASLVVCEHGRLKRSEYRKFRIRSAGGSSGADDFAAMAEVVLRRYRRVVEEGGPFPDLVLVDGGQGQLGSAYDSLASLGLSNLVAAGLAKKEERLFVRDRVEPVALARESPALLLIQRIRDEAHRVAVTFHRQARTRRDLRSALDDVPGVGARRRRRLLTRFGSLAGVRRATREELVAVVGRRVADAVLTHFATER